MNIEEIETKLRSLLKGQYSSLSLSFNDASAPNYKSAKEHIDYYAVDVDWVSDEEKHKAVSENSWWSLHWYPNTPVGFHEINASSLSAIFDYLDNGDLP